MRTLKLRWAPGGGEGNGAALCTMRIAARSNPAEPEERAIFTPANLPEDATEKLTVAVPRARIVGLGTRANLAITCPG